MNKTHVLTGCLIVTALVGGVVALNPRNDSVAKVSVEAPLLGAHEAVDFSGNGYFQVEANPNEKHGKAISPKMARAQIKRVSAAQAISAMDLDMMVEEHTENSSTELPDDDQVNVRELNMALLEYQKSRQ